MKFFLLAFALMLWHPVFAQQEKNYVLEINGDTISLSLDEPATLKTRDGKRIPLRLTQKKELGYTDELFSFRYPSSINLGIHKTEDGENIVCISGSGNGILFQKYTDLDPEDMIGVMMDEITGESISAGYKEVKGAANRTLKSGAALKGQRSTLTLDSETNIYEVYARKINKGGVMIVLMIMDPSEKNEVALIEKIWNSIQLKQ